MPCAWAKLRHLYVGAEGSERPDQTSALHVGRAEQGDLWRACLAEECCGRRRAADVHLLDGHLH